MTIRIVIADDQGVIRAALRALLVGVPDFEVVGEAADGLMAVELVVRRQPDVVLMDIRMPGIDGLEATRRITSAQPAVAVVVLTTFDLDEYVFEAVRAGACGFLLKDGDADDLEQAVRVAVRGDALMSPRSLRRLLDEFAATPVPAPDSVAALKALTAREREVLALVAQGFTNADIAAALVISEATAKTHIGNLLAKLHRRDRAQLVITAYEGGLARRPDQHKA